MPPLKDTLHAKSQMVATGKDTAEKTRNQRFFTLPHFFSGRIPHPKRYGNTAGARAWLLQRHVAVTGRRIRRVNFWGLSLGWNCGLCRPELPPDRPPKKTARKKKKALCKWMMKAVLYRRFTYI